jgi:hypothetical protein
MTITQMLNRFCHQQQGQQSDRANRSSLGCSGSARRYTHQKTRTKQRVNMQKTTQIFGMDLIHCHMIKEVLVVINALDVLMMLDMKRG